jgi:hypothetical protein
MTKGEVRVFGAFAYLKEQQRVALGIMAEKLDKSKWKPKKKVDAWTFGSIIILAARDSPNQSMVRSLKVLIKELEETEKMSGDSTDFKKASDEAVTD